MHCELHQLDESEVRCYWHLHLTFFSLQVWLQEAEHHRRELRHWCERPLNDERIYDNESYEHVSSNLDDYSLMLNYGSCTGSTTALRSTSWTTNYEPQVYISHVAFAACDYIGRHCSASSDEDLSQRLRPTHLAFALQTDRLGDRTGTFWSSAPSWLRNLFPRGHVKICLTM